MGDWWSDFTHAVSEQASRAATAAGNTAAWLGDGITHPLDAVGAFVQNTTGTNPAKNAEAAAWNAQWERDHPAEAAAQAAARQQAPYYGTGNPTADAVLNAVGGVGVGVNTTFNESGNFTAPNVHAGTAPTNVLAPRDIEGQADAAIAAQGAKMPGWSIPPNPSSTNVGASSYNPLTPTINQVGYTNAMNPQERPTSLGLTPIDVGQPGSDSNVAGWQGAKALHGPGSADWNSSSPDYTQAGGSTYTPASGFDAQGRPLHGPGSADWNSNGPDYTGQALIAGAGVLGAGVNLVNGNKIADAEKEAATTQAKGYTDALAQNQAQFDKTQENIKPWLDAGKTALPKLESFDADHPRGDFTASPDYAFRLSEGLKALRNTAGAQGSLVSGETMKAASNYAGNAASQEYGNWYNRSENSRNTDRAALQSLAGIGQTAVGQSNAAGQAFATNAGNMNIGMSNAMAAGTTGAANATASGYQSGAQTLMGGINSAIQLGQNQEQYNALLKLLEKNKAN